MLGGLADPAAGRPPPPPWAAALLLLPPPAQFIGGGDDTARLASNGELGKMLAAQGLKVLA